MFAAAAATVQHTVCHQPSTSHELQGDTLPWKGHKCLVACAEMQSGAACGSLVSGTGAQPVCGAICWTSDASCDHTGQYIMRLGKVLCYYYYYYYNYFTGLGPCLIALLGAKPGS
jgi:hypothetical protein